MRRKEELAKKSRSLQEYAEQKHEVTTTLDDPKKVEELKKEEEALNTQIEEMKQAWTGVRQDMEQNLEKKKKVLADKKVEYTYKAEQIKQMKKEISDSLREMRKKEEIIKYLEEEYGKTPKGRLKQYG
jgi:hypothetical protein